MPAAAASLMLAAASLCPSAPAPQTRVETAAQATEIRRDLSQADLKAFRADTDLPYQMRDLSHVETGGMMRGDITVQYDIRIAAVPGNTAETVNQTCLRYTDIKITLDLAPVIYVARDYAPGSCWYDQILQHEQSHIDTDRVVVEKYAARLKDGLALAFSQPGDAIQGPVEAGRAGDLKKTMGKQVMDMTDILVRDMAQERQRQQQGVDSLRGYAYIMDQCSTGGKIYRLKP